jgi:hypothetical protein
VMTTPTPDPTRLEAGLTRLYRGLETPPRRAPQAAADTRPARLAVAPAPHRPRLGRPRLIFALALACAAAIAVGGVLALRSQPIELTGFQVILLSSGDDLNCQLPIHATSADGSVGFIDFANGQAHFQPVRTSGTTYLAALGRWVPVGAQYVSPDGTEYVSASGPQTIVVTGPTSSRVVYRVPQGSNYVLLGWSLSGIVLLDQGLPAPRLPVGGDVLLLSPSSGTITRYSFAYPALSNLSGFHVTGSAAVLEPGSNYLVLLSTESNTRYTKSGGVYIMTTAPGGDSAFNVVDLATGISTDYFDPAHDGSGIANVVAVTAAGQPIVQLADIDLAHTAPSERAGYQQTTFLMPAPHQRLVLNSGTVGQPGSADSFSGISQVQGSIIWLATDGGQIWRYDAGSGQLTEVAAIHTSTQGAPGVEVVGKCV